ncbi:46032_t:CDS:2 [Gigaspora margarita]|uniref:46032_t:CDS:1 n=1 Tax=Gigaspora margarita TaxID=4874 RepID=A0ABN7VWE5_GIGMA|nr:46032_t:CDS:2 [Gigaspora margarita]
MSQIHTLSDIGKGNKLGDLPSNRYPPSRTELENLLNQANQDCKIAIECGNRLAHKCSILDKNNKHMQQDLYRSNKDKEKLSKHIYQLIDESPPKDLGSLSLAKYFVRKPKTENSQVDRDIQESLTQQTLTNLNDNIPKESEISNEKQINNGQVRSNISPKISPESSSHIISEIKSNNIPIREIEALPVVALGAGEALVNYKYQIPPIVKLVHQI